MSAGFCCGRLLRRAIPSIYTRNGVQQWGPPLAPTANDEHSGMPSAHSANPALGQKLDVNTIEKIKEKI